MLLKAVLKRTSANDIGAASGRTDHTERFARLEIARVYFDVRMR